MRLCHPVVVRYLSAVPPDEPHAPAHHPHRTTSLGLAAGLVLIAVVAAVGLYRQRYGPPGRPPYHVVQFLAVCHEARRGPDGLDMRGVITELAADSFPTRINLTVVTALQPDVQGRRFLLECSTADGSVSLERELRAGLEPGRASLQTVTFEGLELKKPGTLRFHLLCDDTPMIWRVVPVLKRGS